MEKLIFKILLIFLVFGSMTSCVKYDQLFLGRKEGEPRQFPVVDTIQNLEALKIQKNDVLAITVHTLDPTLSTPFNLMSTQGGGGGGGGNVIFTTYIVDEKGEIDYPVLGKIKVAGLSRTEVKEELVVLLKNYLKDPVVNVRFTNFRISVLGEVRKPGSFNISNDRITILEAIGTAGDLTPFSNRNNILVVREIDGVRVFGEIDLQSPDLFKSEYYYLKQGDVVYIEPTKAKEASIRDQFSEYLPWVTGILSAVNVLVLIINRV